MHKNIYNEKHRLCDIANSTLIFFLFLHKYMKERGVDLDLCLWLEVQL